MRHRQPSPDAGLDRARTFIEAAPWVFAATMPWAAHQYTTRFGCRERGIEVDFEHFVVLIEAKGYWRPWGRHHWRSIDVDDWTFWLHHNYVASPRERTVVNRWRTSAMNPAPAQLSLLDDEGAQ